MSIYWSFGISTRVRVRGDSDWEITSEKIVIA